MRSGEVGTTDEKKPLIDGEAWSLMLLQGSLKFPPTPVAKSVQSVGVCNGV